ncbi:glycoside hydrolase family protein [Rhizorhapis sp. SPR117]|nr:glycoside hydrolase family protein [Rhizorhapis sp. SPR117]
MRLVYRAIIGILAPIYLFCSIPLFAADCQLEHINKVGVGVWPVRGTEALRNELGRLNAGWFYNWQPKTNVENSKFVPMIWSGRDLPYVLSTQSRELLTFNEPDRDNQANMDVDLALAYWPTLMLTGKRLGSPATSTGNEIGEESWLGRFMSAARKRNYRVDFISVHYYSSDKDVEAFKLHLERIHQAYDRPVWVTEWALADWSNPSRFSPEEQASFFRSASRMLDDLPFVERHAWFGLYEGLDGWRLGSGLVVEGRLSPVGAAFVDLMTCRVVPSSDRSPSTPPSESLPDPI